MRVGGCSLGDCVQAVSASAPTILAGIACKCGGLSVRWDQAQVCCAPNASPSRSLPAQAALQVPAPWAIARAMSFPTLCAPRGEGADAGVIITSSYHNNISARRPFPQPTPAAPPVRRPTSTHCRTARPSGSSPQPLPGLHTCTRSKAQGLGSGRGTPRSGAGRRTERVTGTAAPLTWRASCRRPTPGRWAGRGIRGCRLRMLRCSP